jgi:hypothetical protein
MKTAKEIKAATEKQRKEILKGEEIQSILDGALQAADSLIESRMKEGYFDCDISITFPTVLIGKAVIARFIEKMSSFGYKCDANETNSLSWNYRWINISWK